MTDTGQGELLLPVDEEAEEVQYHDDTVVEETPAPAHYRDTTLWKKWTVYGGVGRFLTIRPWVEAGKISIDIGETGEGGTLVGHSQVWANLLDLTTFLKAVRDGRGELLYPTDPKLGAATPEGYAYYGGANIKGQAVSRILKVHHWGTKEGYDSKAFVWKAGHFNARVSKTGAFIPNMNESISAHFIKVSRVEMASLALALEMTMVNHAANTPTADWLEQISGRRKQV